MNTATALDSYGVENSVGNSSLTHPFEQPNGCIFKIKVLP